MSATNLTQREIAPRNHGAASLAWRRRHRALMITFGLVLAYWVGSGFTMAVYDATDARQAWAIEGGGPGARLYPGAADASELPLPASHETGVARAEASAAALAIASVRSVAGGGRR